jgi:hypothetical protein
LHGAQDYLHHTGTLEHVCKKVPLKGVYNNTLVLGDREPLWEWLNFNLKDDKVNVRINKTWHVQTWVICAKTPLVGRPFPDLTSVSEVQIMM